ncbi:hypothetical protein CkaCkLH20_06345 [Colletotrichum karsti]|uniref:CENP-V/GFA domain-containing protein n=1 Tax=Colletotrichum karsti TaxID=1095194 RepID=A0A9P6I3S5_9PEZI|nr:uncharacterized protein CkaCkLH20_06345 [Colletotrichum karsti]KAF9876402.1 hypothetical protein CkaCkLH20_06345 [Colletotrichum karsti]
MANASSETTIALVTGANQGIGYEIAKRLASEHPDYHVYMTGRRKDAIEKAAAELRSAGLDVEPMVLDVTSDDDIAAAVEQVRSKYGRIDVIINNAGICIPDPKDPVRQRLKHIFDTNIFGAVALTEAFMPLLEKSTKTRRVVMVSSGLGSLQVRTDPNIGPNRDFLEYGASKAALNHACLTFASRHYGDNSWKFNTCCPGYCATNMNSYTGPDDASLGSIRPVQLATLGPDGVTATFSNRQGRIPWAHHNFPASEILPGVQLYYEGNNTVNDNLASLDIGGTPSRRRVRNHAIMSEATPSRRPFKGSCHCGETQFIVFLMFPHAIPPPRPPKEKAPRSHQEFYRCNCTTCHKAGFFHMRLESSPDDFLLLKPLDPYKELGDYQVYQKDLHFLFCKTCGMRCLIFMGKGEVVEVDLETLGFKSESGNGDNRADSDAKLTKIWRPLKDGWLEGKKFGSYLSVNGYAVDAGQEGFDLREITEKKWVGYLDWLELHEDSQGVRHDRPWAGGAY